MFELDEGKTEDIMLILLLKKLSEENKDLERKIKFRERTDNRT